MRKKEPMDNVAVTAVIGVILMIAVTVVLGAVVFLVAQKLAQHPDNPTPHIAFAQQQGNVLIASIPLSPVDWYKDVRPAGTCGPHVKLTPVGTGTLGPYPTAPGIIVKAGDVLSNCASGETLTLVYTPTEAILYSDSFR